MAIDNYDYPRLKRLAWFILNVDEDRIQEKLERENLTMEEASIVFVLSSLYEHGHNEDVNKICPGSSI